MIRQQKEEVVRLLLENSSYMPDSGMVQNLKEELLAKLSMADLSALKLIMDIKLYDAHKCGGKND